MPYLHVFIASLCRADGLTDWHERWFKLSRLLQGNAFWGLHSYEIIFRGQNPSKNRKFWNPNAKLPAKATQLNSF